MQAATLPLRVEDSWRRGDPRGDTRTHRSGGLRIRVSAQDGGHVPAQIEEAQAFLGLHRETLGRLLSRPDIDTVLLDFSWDVPAGGTVQWSRWPPALCKLCGDLGIAIEATVYVTDPR